MEPDPSQSGPQWHTRELDVSDASRLRVELDSNAPQLIPAFQRLAAGLTEPGTSRTVFILPIMFWPKDANRAIVEGVAVASERLHAMRHSQALLPLQSNLELRENESPNQFDPRILSNPNAASMSPDTPIGYMRIEVQQDGTVVPTVGALVPQTGEHVFMHAGVPLS